MMQRLSAKFSTTPSSQVPPSSSTPSSATSSASVASIASSSSSNLVATAAASSSASASGVSVSTPPFGAMDLSKRFKKVSKIGKGSFGDVYKGMDLLTNETVAIKIIDLESAEEEIDEIRKEISVLSECNSPHITKYITSYTHGPELCIVMEYLGGGSVHSLLQSGPLDENSVAIVTRELLKAIDYLHGCGKIHRDIKCANILLSERGDVKIADFGVTGQLTKTVQRRNTFVGTPFWMAPEVIQQADYNEKADIWSVGITVIEMIKGDPPFHDLHPVKALFLIPKSEPPNLENSMVSRNLKDFVAVCCQKEAEKRPTVKELLRHRFIRGAKKNTVLVDLLTARTKKRENGESEESENSRSSGKHSVDTAKQHQQTPVAGGREERSPQNHRNPKAKLEKISSSSEQQENSKSEWLFTLRTSIDEGRAAAVNATGPGISTGSDSSAVSPTAKTTADEQKKARAIERQTVGTVIQRHPPANNAGGVSAAGGSGGKPVSALNISKAVAPKPQKPPVDPAISPRMVSSHLLSSPRSREGKTPAAYSRAYVRSEIHSGIHSHADWEHEQYPYQAKSQSGERELLEEDEIIESPRGSETDRDKGEKEGEEDDEKGEKDNRGVCFSIDEGTVRRNVMASTPDLSSALLVRDGRELQSDFFKTPAQNPSLLLGGSASFSSASSSSSSSSALQHNSLQAVKPALTVTVPPNVAPTPAVIVTPVAAPPAASSTSSFSSTSASFSQSSRTTPPSASNGTASNSAPTRPVPHPPSKSSLVASANTISIPISPGSNSSRTSDDDTGSPGSEEKQNPDAVRAGRASAVANSLAQAAMRGREKSKDTDRQRASDSAESDDGTVRARGSEDLLSASGGSRGRKSSVVDDREQIVTSPEQTDQSDEEAIESKDDVYAQVISPALQHILRSVPHGDDKQDLTDTVSKLQRLFCRLEANYRGASAVFVHDAHRHLVNFERQRVFDTSTPPSTLSHLVPLAVPVSLSPASVAHHNLRVQTHTPSAAVSDRSRGFSRSTEAEIDGHRVVLGSVATDQGRLRSSARVQSPPSLSPVMGYSGGPWPQPETRMKSSSISTNAISANHPYAAYAPPTPKSFIGVPNSPPLGPRSPKGAAWQFSSSSSSLQSSSSASASSAASASSSSNTSPTHQSHPSGSRVANLRGLWQGQAQPSPPQHTSK